MTRKDWSHPDKEMRLYWASLKREWLEICDFLASGNISDLEFAADVVDGFPHGKDGFIQRYWIVHAIDCGSIESIEWMIEKNVDLRPVGTDGYPPVVSCVERETQDRYQILERLIRAGADIDERGINGWTPLHLAALREDEHAMQMLLDAGADRSKRTDCDDNATAEEEARAMGHEISASFIASYEVKT